MEIEWFVFRSNGEKEHIDSVRYMLEKYSMKNGQEKNRYEDSVYGFSLKSQGKKYAKLNYERGTLDFYCTIPYDVVPSIPRALPLNIY